jgi:hypothetical protein
LLTARTGRITGLLDWITEREAIRQRRATGKATVL